MIFKLTCLLITNFILFKITFYLFQKYKLLDIPSGALKIHEAATPYNGGIVLFLNIIFILILNFNFQFLYPNFLIFLLLLTSLFIMCFIDDINNISPNLRFFITIIILTLFLIFYPSLRLENLRFEFIDYSIEFYLYSLPISVFCLFAFIQAINMLDGINGQVAIYITVLLIITNLLSQNISIYFLPFLAIFLFYNLSGKSFLGDSGSYLLAFCTGLLLINLYQKKIFSADEVFLLISIPGYEMIRLFTSRIINKKNPFLGDRHHIHHLLLNKYNTKVTTIFSSFILVTPCVLITFLDNNLIVFIVTLLSYSCTIIFLKKNS